MQRACFECGSLDHFARNCPLKRHVQEVGMDNGEPEILVIGAVLKEGAETEDSDDKQTDEFIEVLPKKRKQKKYKKITLKEAKEYGIEFKTNLEASRERDRITMTKQEILKSEVCAVDNLEWQEESFRCVVGGEPVDREACKIGATDGTYVSLGIGEVTVDSAADESCWPEDVGGAFELKPSKHNIKLVAANGTVMRHAGEKEITFRNPGENGVMAMTFQVTEVRKALAAVHRLTEKGNIVQFGPEEHHCFIKNIVTGKKIQMFKKGRSYVLRVEFVKWIPNSQPPFQGQAR